MKDMVYIITYVDDNSEAVLVDGSPIVKGDVPAVVICGITSDFTQACDILESAICSDPDSNPAADYEYSECSPFTADTPHIENGCTKKWVVESIRGYSITGINLSDVTGGTPDIISQSMVTSYFNSINSY